MRQGSLHFTFGKECSAFHHVNGVGIKLANDAGFRLVFAKTEHAEAGNQDYGWAGVAQSRRVRTGK